MFLVLGQGVEFTTQLSPTLWIKHPLGSRVCVLTIGLYSILCSYLGCMFMKMLRLQKSELYNIYKKNLRSLFLSCMISQSQKRAPDAQFFSPLALPSNCQSMRAFKSQLQWPQFINLFRSIIANTSLSMPHYYEFHLFLR